MSTRRKPRTSTRGWCRDTPLDRSTSRPHHSFAGWSRYHIARRPPSRCRTDPSLPHRTAWLRRRPRRPPRRFPPCCIAGGDPDCSGATQVRKVGSRQRRKPEWPRRKAPDLPTSRTPCTAAGDRSTCSEWRPECMRHTRLRGTRWLGPSTERSPTRPAPSTARGSSSSQAGTGPRPACRRRRIRPTHTPRHKWSRRRTLRSRRSVPCPAHRTGGSHLCRRRRSRLPGTDSYTECIATRRSGTAWPGPFRRLSCPLRNRCTPPRCSQTRSPFASPASSRLSRIAPERLLCSAARPACSCLVLPLRPRLLPRPLPRSRPRPCQRRRPCQHRWHPTRRYPRLCRPSRLGQRGRR